MTKHARPRRWTPRVILVGIGLLLASCAENAPMDALQPAGPIARQIDNLWDVVFWIAVAVFIVVEGILVFALFRFRAGKRTDEPRQVHGNTRLEIAWTIAPAVLLAALAVPTVSTIFSLAEEPEDPLRVTAVGWQWWFEYEYPELGVVTANELHIPTDRPVYLTLRSEDVIHSFWVPSLAGKQDMVPGDEKFMTIQADEPGWYEGQCAEYCGISHANMRLRVRADTPEDFEAWVDAMSEEPSEPTSQLARRGKEIFEAQACVGCHTIEGVSQGETGPNLTHVASRETFAGALFELNEENLTQWVSDAPGMKPGAKMPAGMAELGLTPEDVDALVAYLMTLR